MNLIILAVWSGLLLSCTVSLPRRRQVKYPVTKFQNSHYERSHPTALEELERTLLRPSGSMRRHSRRRCGSKRSVQLFGDESTSPLHSEVTGGRKSNKKTDEIDACVVSFGDQSPLCKPRKRLKKSFLAIPDTHKRLFRSNAGDINNMTITTPDSPDDFFGLFKSSELPLNDSEEFISKSTVSALVTTTYIIPLKTKETSSIQTSTSNSEQTSLVSITQIVTSPEPPIHQTPKDEYINGSHINSTTDSVSKNEASRIILPGSVQQIESEPQFLYLEGDKIPNMDSKPESHSKAIAESDGDSVMADGSEKKSAEETETETESTTHLTLPTLMNSFLTGETYSKEVCEAEKNQKCICSFSSVDSDFQTIFSKAKLGEEVMAEVANMRCRRYNPKPSVFDLNTNAKPRVLKGKHTPFAVDNRKGAKEVTQKSLDEFIYYSSIDDGITRVFVSSDVKIPCFPKPDIHLSATDADHVKYTWTFGNKKESITQGRIKEDSDGDGSLTIEDIELTDAMNYSCEIDYIHPDTGERTTDTFVHSLSVVTLPTVSARAVVHYKSTAACDESLLEMFEMYLPQQVEKTICSPDNDRPQLCSVVIHSPVCHSEGQATPEEKSKRQIAEGVTSRDNTDEEESESTEETSYEDMTRDESKRETRPEDPLDRGKREESSMEMSLNYDVFIHRPGVKALPGANTNICDPDCYLLINFKLLQMLKESAQEVAFIPIISKVQGGGTFTPVPDSVKVKYIFGCMGGYYLDNGFCLACPKGTYSDDGATECQECPLHTYSGTVGTRRCTPCKHLWMPVCNEHFESINIMMIWFVVLAVVLLLLIFIVYYFIWYKGQTLKELMKKSPKEKIAKSERVRHRKEAKREKQKTEKEAKKLAKIDEMKRLLQSSGESGTESEPEDSVKTKRGESKRRPGGGIEPHK